MIVRRHGFHNGAMAYMLEFGESTIHRSFFLNLKHDDRFLPHSMPEIFSKTEHGLQSL